MRKLSVWNEQYSPGESIDLLRDLALSHCLKGGKQGAEISQLVRSCRFRELCDYEFSYDLGATPEEVRHCRQALAFFTKLEDLDIGIDKEAVAYEKFVKSEELCASTNDIFDLRERGEFFFLPRVESVLYRAQRKIAYILGDVPSFEQLGFRFGPGATTRTRKRVASVRRKLSDKIACSQDLIPYVKTLLGEMPQLSYSTADVYVDDGEEIVASVPVLIEDASLSFVAKNAKTYRTIVTEPPLNSMFQLGVGDYMFERLARSGLNLRSQELNQNLACLGSLTDALATLDLESASDTVALGLVTDLLPFDWALFLSRGRSSRVRSSRNKDPITLSKFSSMGNGFTFPLESLIFWAIAGSCCERGEVVTVYGDDIILPTSRVALCVEVLTACGFIINRKKSYTTGPFRESCGKDYYRGMDVRPFYQKEWVSPRTLFILHNFYVRKGEADLAKRVRGWIHPCLQLFGPDGYGDGHLLGFHLKKVKPRHTRNGYSGYLFDTFTVKGRSDIRPAPGDYVLPAYSIYRRSPDTLLDVTELLSTQLASSRRTGFVPAASLLRSNFLQSDTFSTKVEGAPLPLADSANVDEPSHPTKVLTLPGSDGYKRISVYTLGS